METNSNEKNNRLRVAFLWILINTFSFFVFCFFVSISLMNPFLKNSLSLTYFQIAQLSSWFLVPFVIFLVLRNTIIKKYSIKKTFIITSFFFILSTFAFISVHSFVLLSAARIFMGVFGLFAVGIAIEFSSSFFNNSKSALIKNIIEASYLIGGGLGVIMMSYLINLYRWRIALLIILVFQIIFLSLFIILEKKAKILDFKTIKNNDEEFEKISVSLRKVAKNKMVWLEGIKSGILFSIIISFASLWYVPFLNTFYQMNIVIASKICSLIFIGAIIGSILIRNFFKNFDNNLIMKISCFICSILFLIILVINLHIWLLEIFTLFLGVFSSSFIFSFLNLSEIVDGKLKKTAASFLSSIIILVGIILQLIIGALLMVINSYNLALLIFPILLILSSGIFNVLTKRIKIKKIKRKI